MTTIDLSYHVAASPSTVFEYLSDMQKFASVHPVISKIESLDHSLYRAIETLKFGFIPYTFQYQFLLETDANNNSVHMHAVVMRLTTLDLKFNVKQMGDHSTVNETITIRSWLPTHFMKTIFITQHKILFRNIEQKINEQFSTFTTPVFNNHL